MASSGETGSAPSPPDVDQKMNGSSELRCALWGRVSKPDQDTGAQHLALRQEAERRGFTVARVFDVTASGYHGQQEHEFTKLVDGLRRGEYAVVICWAIDRLTRQGVSETLLAVNRIATAGGTLISLQEPWIETGGELRELLLAVVGWVANFESRRRSERVKAGLARRKAAGLPVGRIRGAKDRKPRKISGYYVRHGR